MPPQAIPKSRPLRVLYVDDTDRTDPDKVKEYSRKMRQNFWRAASTLCSNRASHGETARCEDCPFTLDFFPFFPRAMYALLENERYDVYLVDIHADVVEPNRWDASEYKNSRKSFANRLKRLLPDLGKGTLINGEHHIIPLISKLPHRIRPFVVWMSIKYQPQRALDLGGNVSMIATKDKDLQGVLVTALNTVRPQISEQLTVPLPLESISLEHRSDQDYPVYLDFNQRRLSLAAGREITTASGTVITSGLSENLEPNFALEEVVGGRKGVALRHLVRGGRIPKCMKDEIQPYPSKFFVSPKTEHEVKARKTLLSGFPELQRIRAELDKKVVSNSEFTYWDRNLGLELVSSVDVAWRYLYHAVVQLFVLAVSEQEHLSAFVGSQLAQDASLFQEKDSLNLAGQFARRSNQIGVDEFAHEVGDLEFLWIPKLVSFAADDKSDQVDALEEIRALRRAPALAYNHILQNESEQEKLIRLTFFKGWWWSDIPNTLLTTLFEISTGSADKKQLRHALFQVYSEGKSIYERF